MPWDKCRGLNFLLQNFYSWTLFFSALKKTESSSRDSEDKEESWLLTGSSLDCKGRLSEKTLKKNTNLPATSLRGGGGQQELPWEELEAMRWKTVVERVCSTQSSCSCVPGWREAGSFSSLCSAGRPRCPRPPWRAWAYSARTGPGPSSSRTPGRGWRW